MNTTITAIYVDILEKKLNSLSEYDQRYAKHIITTFKSKQTLYGNQDKKLRQLITTLNKSAVTEAKS